MSHLKRLLRVIAALTITSFVNLAMAQETRIYEAANGPISIPTSPQRIVSLHDLSITLPLVEFGATDRVVGSHGRVNSDGSQFIAAASTLFDVNFDNSDIEFIGSFDNIDVEKIAILKPDLIIGRFGGQDKDFIAQLEKIAPTILIDLGKLDYFGRIEAVAEAAALKSLYEEKFAAFNQRIADGKMLLPNASEIDASFLLPWAEDGTIGVAKKYYALSEVLDALEVGRHDYVDQMDGNYNAVSAEILPLLDGDFVFSTYDPTSADRQSPLAIKDQFEQLLPGYCNQLHACRERQMIFLPAWQVYSSSFKSLDSALDYVLTHLAERDFAPLTSKQPLLIKTQKELIMKKFLMMAAFLGALTVPTFAQETRTYIDALDRSVEIPVAPQRIISMHDHALTLPLVELGASVVGSNGRVREDGSTCLRSVNTVMNVDFDNSEIEFIGAWNSIHFEKIASLEPDLIIARAPWDEEHLGKLSAIGPTVFVDDTADALELYKSIADVAGKLDEYNYLRSQYESLITDAKGWLGDKQYTYSKIQASDGRLLVYAHYGVLTRVLDDLGFQISATGAEFRKKNVGWGEEVSAELLPEQDADFLFDTYRIDQGQVDGPQVAWERMETVLPNFCALLSACQKGNYIFIPREHAAPNSFATLTMNVHYVVSHVAGRHHAQ